MRGPTHAPCGVIEGYLGGDMVIRVKMCACNEVRIQPRVFPVKMNCKICGVSFYLNREHSELQIQVSPTEAPPLKQVLPRKPKVKKTLEVKNENN